MKAFELVRFWMPWSTEKHCHASSREIKQWIKDGAVHFNGQVIKDPFHEFTGLVEITLFSKNTKRKNSLSIMSADRPSNEIASWRQNEI